MSEETKQWTVKYRPKLFADYLGNHNMVDRVTGLLKKNKLPQTLLLQGERGTGKTSMARLLAKSILCEDLQQGKACEQCKTCKTLNKEFIYGGKVPKRYEIYSYNITQMNSVTDATAIVGRMNQRTLQQGKRIFILDEIQRASKEAQSTLLPIAEDPPAGVTIILCTTNPEQLLKPLRSRFTPLQVKPPTKQALSKYIEHICREEGVNFTKEAVKLLVHKLGANPRESINMVQYLAESGDLTRSAVETELEITKRETYYEYLIKCKKGNISEIVGLLEKENIRQEIHYDNFIQNLGEYLVELIELKAHVNLDLYSVEKSKNIRAEYEAIGEEKVLEILKILRPYAHIPNATNYLLVTLAIEIMDLYRVNHEELNEEQEGRNAKKAFNHVGRQIKDEQPKREVAEVTEGEFADIFGGQEVEIDME